jgi:hypothetical protein
MSQFGTTIQGRDLATENKTAIAFLLRNSILTLLSNLYSDRDVFATLQENTRAIIGDVASLKNELSRVREKFRDGTVRLGMKYLEEISRNNGRRYGFSESAMKKLKDYQGELENLPAILDQAARYADTFSVEPEQEMTLISDFHIVFKETGPKVTPPKVLEYTGDVPAKYGKTVILLDKLENAARQVKSKNMLLTSQNLVGELPTPVSPPAISDALKKHRNKILYLFREFPTRWELIRKEFRPVQNILNVRQDRAQLTG